ncbi:MAG TPA: ParB N-terminal domain-containing protein [Anaeromyxobacter sp.]|nr:ParB N-terminal domain-containing protein [Anaeromyxobacter sp.]
MELEPRTAAPAHATGAVAFVPLAALSDDRTFQLRDEGDVAGLAASMGRLGQLVPVELRPLPGASGGEPRYQVVAGFRRLAALRLLARERVLARVHDRLDDDDAWGLALAQALLAEPLDREAIRALGERLQEEGVATWAGELVDEALLRAPVEPALRERFAEFLEQLPARRAAGGRAPAAEEEEAEPAEDEEVEVTPEELVADLAQRLYEVNADLAVAYEAWSDLPAEGRRQILEQARWIAELVPHLEREGDDR